MVDCLSSVCLIDGMTRVDLQSPITIKGVVFNEMKGAMASADRQIYQHLLSAMFPNTTYYHNSGGDPNHIPSLTYEQLKSFHQRFYHPSNARFYSYGKSLIERLKKMKILPLC
jgi:presequence protease